MLLAIKNPSVLVEGTCLFVTDCSDRWCPISNASYPDNPYAVVFVNEASSRYKRLLPATQNVPLSSVEAEWYELWKLRHGVKYYLPSNPFQNKHYQAHHHQSWCYQIPSSTLNHTFMSNHVSCGMHFPVSLLWLEGFTSSLKPKPFLTRVTWICTSSAHTHLRPLTSNAFSFRIK